jgi:dTDP-4-dehydrorhamnose 3,5-epimerase-like enzyme
MIADCRLINLPQFHDPRGNLTWIESENQIPFPVRRIFYLYDVPGGAERGGHAHKSLHQFLIAVSGSFDVHLDDGRSCKTVHLNRAHFGLYVPPMTWGNLDNFSGSSICLVLASEVYDEEDYYRKHDEFIAAVKHSA